MDFIINTIIAKQSSVCNLDTVDNTFINDQNNQSQYEEEFD